MAWHASAMTVAVLGSVNQDVVCRVTRLPHPGETVTAAGVATYQGGKGANQAIAAARMGAQVRFSGAVGADAAGAELREELQAAGVASVNIRTLECSPTGTAYILISAAGENQIVVAPGANSRLTAEDGRLAASGASVLLAQLEVPTNAIAAFFAAGEPRAVRILNTAPAEPAASALFQATDLLILNQTELAGYLRLDAEPRTPEEATVARALLTRAGQAAIVTLGAMGAVLVEQAGWFHAPAFTVPVIDTTGAGDCFCGALAALIAAGHATRDALVTANAAAALSVRQPGAGPAMPRAEEVAAFLTAATEHAPPIKTG